ncbi:MAG: helix-hairpin-helix domain-containing protein [Sulfurospirillum sp.]|nr:helix-hairpin-helix domain-containing protein [Sulfurospirillum sp.]
MKFFLSLALGFAFLLASVDINNADEKELSTLQGVGDKKAKEIITYRDTNGCFKSSDELTKVKGISEKTVAKNKDAIIIGTCKKQ